MRALVAVELDVGVDETLVEVFAIYARPRGKFSPCIIGPGLPIEATSPMWVHVFLHIVHE